MSFRKSPRPSYRVSVPPASPSVLASRIQTGYAVPSPGPQIPLPPSRQPGSPGASKYPVPAPKLSYIKVDEPAQSPFKPSSPKASYRSRLPIPPASPSVLASRASNMTSSAKFPVPPPSYAPSRAAAPAPVPQIVFPQDEESESGEIWYANLYEDDVYIYQPNPKDEEMRTRRTAQNASFIDAFIDSGRDIYPNLDYYIKLGEVIATILDYEHSEFVLTTELLKRSLYPSYLRNASTHEIFKLYQGPAIKTARRLIRDITEILQDPIVDPRIRDPTLSFVYNNDTELPLLSTLLKGYTITYFGLVRTDTINRTDLSPETFRDSLTPDQEMIMEKIRKSVINFRRGKKEPYPSQLNQYRMVPLFERARGFKRSVLKRECLRLMGTDRKTIGELIHPGEKVPNPNRHKNKIIKNKRLPKIYYMMVYNELISPRAPPTSSSKSSSSSSSKSRSSSGSSLPRVTYQYQPEPTGAEMRINMTPENRDFIIPFIESGRQIYPSLEHYIKLGKVLSYSSDYYIDTGLLRRDRYPSYLKDASSHEIFKLYQGRAIGDARMLIKQISRVLQGSVIDPRIVDPDISIIDDGDGTELPLLSTLLKGYSITYFGIIRTNTFNRTDLSPNSFRASLTPDQEMIMEKIRRRVLNFRRGTGEKFPSKLIRSDFSPVLEKVKGFQKNVLRDECIRLIEETQSTLGNLIHPNDRIPNKRRHLNQINKTKRLPKIYYMMVYNELISQ